MRLRRKKISTPGPAAPISTPAMQDIDAARRELAKVAARLRRDKDRRAELIRQLNDAGLSFDEIGQLADIHRSRAWQIYHRKT